MSAYKIQRWDAVTANNVLKRPMIYVKPDTAFLSFVRANQFAVLCQISGTGMDYDHIPGSSVKIPGIVSKSSVVPNCRPNYYAATEYYVITLLAPWIGYPSKNLGEVKFFGLKEGIRTQLPAKKEKPSNPQLQKPLQLFTPKSKSGSSSKNKKSIIIGIIATVVLLAISGALYIHFRK